jgi:hypothetical protein
MDSSLSFVIPDHGCPRFPFRFRSDGLAVAAGEEAFVVESAVLAVEGAGAPILIGRLVHVPRAGRLIVDAEQQPVVGPAQI